ncbi:unnamed protein product [Clavelina lepadiformis]|uniref:Homeobox domain-containing protein n=1 Tax=Clavelina lepadiformis TaxID=159417 RepID=A0ABP0F9N5_CLALP
MLVQEEGNLNMSKSAAQNVSGSFSPGFVMAADPIGVKEATEGTPLSTQLTSRVDYDSTMDESIFSPSRSNSDSSFFQSFQPLSSSWSSGVASKSPSSDTSAIESESKTEEEQQEIKNKMESRSSLFTIDAILSKDSSKKHSEFRLKRPAELRREREVKISRPLPSSESYMLPVYGNVTNTSSAPPHQQGNLFANPVIQSVLPGRDSISTYQWTLHKTYMESYLQSNNPAHMMNPYLARNGFSYPMTTTVGWSYPTFPSLWTGFKTEIAGGPRNSFSHQDFRSPIQECPATGNVDGICRSPKSDKSKRMRTIFTSDQLDCLEREFEKQHYMVGNERYFLARQLNLNEAQVKIWFQNRRIKWRKERQQTGNNTMKPAPSKSNFSILCEKAASSDYR